MSKHKSLKHAVEILDLYSAESYELGGTDISRKLKLSTANVSRLLKTMESLAIVRKNAKTRKYFLGSKIVELAKVYLSNIDLKLVARPYLEELSQKTNELITFNILKNDQCYLVDWIESKRSIQQVIEGDKFTYPPMYAVAPGKLLLAYMSDRKIEDLLTHMEFKKYTERTITDIKLLKQQINEIREKNLAVARGEFLRHTFGVSAPVYHWSGKVVAALAISWLTINDKPENLNEYSSLVKDSTQRLSTDLGYKFFDQLKAKVS
jgi:IclR family KDG regulon transcriptional repressor